MSNEIDLTDYDDGGLSVSAQFDRKKIDRSKNYEGHLMVTMKAEDPDFKRPPVSIVLCIDRSGSMSGQPLEAVKETARKIVENLAEQDEISIVVYEDAVDIIQERVKCREKEKLFALISGIATGGCTNMSGGMLESFRQINEKLEGVKRVMLLTDGLANRGVADRDGLLDLVKKRDSNCTLSTFGYGDSCDQELLADLAKEGGGNYYYIGDNKDVKEVFARELGGVLSCMAQNIAMKISPNKGNKVVEVLNDYTVDDKNGVAIVRAEDIYAGETKDVLVKMKVSTPKGKAKDRPFSVAKIEVTFDDLRLKKKVVEGLNVKVEFVKAEEADKDTVLAVAEKVAMLTAAKAQVEAVRYANRGEFRAAKKAMVGGLNMLRAAADRGSVSASSMSSSVSASTSSMSSDAYTEKFGQELRTANLGMMKSRSTGKGYEGLIGTKAQADMENKFKAPSLVPPKPPKSQKKGGGFGKKRSRR